MGESNLWAMNMIAELTGVRRQHQWHRFEVVI